MVKLDEVKQSAKPTDRADGVASDGVKNVKSNAYASKKALHSERPQSKLRGRSLIYIDPDDDVTSIVGKIKGAEDAVVALVPPKRSNVLHSVVNLKLLDKAAKDNQKVMAVVTTDQALTNLASGLAIPVAKNINAQAQVADMADIEEISDIIDGEDSYSTLSRNSADDKNISAAVAAIENDDKIHNDKDGDGVPDDEEEVEEEKKPRKVVKSSEKDKKRRKLIISGVVAVLLIVLIVWGVVFAPSATITIKAKTSGLDVSRDLSLIINSDKDVDNGVLASVVKTSKHTNSTNFEATGTREVGEKAKGKVAICNKQDYANSKTGARNTVTVAAGTTMYADGVQFTTDADVSIDGSQTESDRNCVTMRATAVNIGESGNIANGTLLTISGFSRDKVAASADGSFTGGSKRTVKVVQQSDVDAALAKLNEKDDSSRVKDELKADMSSSTAVIDDSFTATAGNPNVSPAVGQEVGDKQPTISVETVYTLVGVDADDLKSLIEASVKAKLADGQKVYSDGSKRIKFSRFSSARNGYTVRVSTTAQVGPQIDEDSIKADAAGKKSEEIKAQIKKTDGVSDVDVVINPFWVQTAPASNKIKVNFAVDE
jgi:hypothetical protein